MKQTEGLLNILEVSDQIKIAQTERSAAQIDMHNTGQVVI
jgi:hypothetical protein